MRIILDVLVCISGGVVFLWLFLDNINLRCKNQECRERISELEIKCITDWDGFNDNSEGNNR